MNGGNKTRKNGTAARTSKPAALRVFQSASRAEIKSDAPVQRADLEIDHTAGSETCATAAGDWIIWQLIDSAFPTGGFAHSAGLEAAWQHGEVRNRDELVSFVEAGLSQLGRAAIPFVTTAWDEPERLTELDELCDVFTSNHVANRASRSQGRAFLCAIERIFNQPAIRNPQSAFTCHFAPVFGGSLRRLNISRRTTLQMFTFNHLRGTFAAAVRLNIVGPMEAQILQRRSYAGADALLARCESLTLDDLAQTAPMLDLWQGAQDRLYSRLFQS